MRQSIIYAIVASSMTLMIVLLMVKQSKWSTDVREAMNSLYNQNINEIIVGKLTPDVSRIIASQPYYKTLCEQDKVRMKNLRQTKPGESTMDTFHSIVMDTFDTACNVKTRLGGVYLSGCHVMDGQKYVCMDELMKDILSNECVVYSFGIGGDMSFEKGISEMGCEVFAYDPTIDQAPYQSDNISFKKIGVVGTPSEDKNYQTLNEILKSNGHSNTKISYLKLDIESHELSGLPIWLDNGDLDNVEQLAIEVHLEPPESDITLKFLETFLDLHLKGQFRIVNWEANNCWKNYNKNVDYFGLSEILLKKTNPDNLCTI